MLPLYDSYIIVILVFHHCLSILGFAVPPFAVTFYIRSPVHPSDTEVTEVRFWSKRKFRGCHGPWFTGYQR